MMGYSSESSRTTKDEEHFLWLTGHGTNVRMRFCLLLSPSLYVDVALCFSAIADAAGSDLFSR